MIAGSGRAAVAMVLLGGVLAGAQQAPVPDSPAVTRRIEQLRAAAGPQWRDAVHFWCEAPRANRADDPPIAPARIFDNVYVIGSIGTVAYVIQTSDGLVMIDALSPSEVESRLLPGLAALGLDPARVTAILVAHGHADHFGGAPYFQQRYGTRVYLSAADWALLEAPSRGRGPAAPALKRDGELTDGEALRFGDVTVTPIAVPGHTAGSMGFIFPVVDRGVPRMAALFGGSWLTPGFLSDEAMRGYIGSVRAFRAATRAAGVDVWLQNHPLMVPFADWVREATTRDSAGRHPLVVGPEGYQAFLDVMEGCSEVALERRGGSVR